MVRVDVTADDIKNGRRSSAPGCPVALALRRLGYNTPHVSGRDVCINHGLDGNNFLAPDHLYVTLPQEVAVFTRAYDDGHAVEPFSFEADLPELTKV